MWEKYKELLIKCGISDNLIEKYDNVKKTHIFYAQVF